MQRLLLFLLLALSLPAQAAELRVYVVRHAEKAADDPRDPGLSPTGQARAEALAYLLRNEPFVAVYATQYRRTQLTASPLAEATHLSIRVRPAGESAASLVARIRADHRDGAVLLVGHSNTVPALVAALSGQTVEPLADDEYDRIFIITIPEQGPARLESARYQVSERSRRRPVPGRFIAFATPAVPRADSPVPGQR